MKSYSTNEFDLVILPDRNSESSTMIALLRKLAEKAVTDVLGTKLKPFIGHRPQQKIYREDRWRTRHNCLPETGTKRL